MGADLTLLRVVTPVYPVTLPAEPAIFGSVATDIMDRVEKMHADLKKDALAYLETIANRLRADGLKVLTRVSVDEQPGIAILEAAKPPIDMVAIGRVVLTNREHIIALEALDKGLVGTLLWLSIRGSVRG